MLPAWNYIFIAVIGYFSTSDKTERLLCVFYMTNLLYLLTIYFAIGYSFDLYMALRYIVMIVPCVLLYLNRDDDVFMLKAGLCIGFMVITNLMFGIGIYSKDLELLAWSYVLSPYCLEYLTAILGFSKWGNMRQAFLGCSIGVFYVYHFFG